MARGEVLAEMVLQGDKKFVSGIEDAGDEMEDTSRSAGILGGALGRMGEQISDALIPTRLLSGQLDEAGDEASEAGRKAGAAALGFGALRISTSGLSFSLGVLTTVGTSTALMLGGLALAAGAVLLALAPLAIGAAAVGAAFGLIVGSGIYAGMSKLQKTFKNVKKQITPLIKEFGQKFVPFLNETLKMLPGLVKSLLDAVGGMDVFLGALRTLRNVAVKFLPKLVKWFFDLGRWALPILTDIGAYVLNKVVPALRKMVDWGKQIWSIVGDWVTQFGKATSKGTTLRKKISKLVGAAKRFWKNLQPVIKALKPFIGELIRLAPVVAGVALDIGRLALNLGSKLLPYLVPIINGLTGLARWFNSLSSGIKRAVIVVGGLFLALGPIISILGTLFSALTTIVGVVGTVIAVFNPLSLALIAIGAVIAGLAYLIYDNWGKIKKWTTNFVSSVVGKIKELGTKIYNTVTGAFGDLISWLQNDAKDDVVGAIGAMGGAIVNAFKGAFNAAMPDSVPIPEITLGAGVPGPDYTIGGGSLDLPSLAAGGRIEESGVFIGHKGEHMMNAAEVDKAEDAPGGGGGGAEQVVVQLDADAVKDLLRGEAVDVFDEKVQETERKKRRRGAF